MPGPGEKAARSRASAGSEPAAVQGEPAAPLRCDFCGQSAPVVRRVALDRGYERLQTPHPVRYACSRCSEEKEQKRLGLRRG
jgi:hypothetical protein